MSEGTAYVVEQLGLALRYKDSEVAQLQQQVAELRAELEKARGDHSHE